MKGDPGQPRAAAGTDSPFHRESRPRSFLTNLPARRELFNTGLSNASRRSELSAIDRACGGCPSFLRVRAALTPQPPRRGSWKRVIRAGPEDHRNSRQPRVGLSRPLGRASGRGKQLAWTEPCVGYRGRLASRQERRAGSTGGVYKGQGLIAGRAARQGKDWSTSVWGRVATRPADERLRATSLQS